MRAQTQTSEKTVHYCPGCLNYLTLAELDTDWTLTAALTALSWFLDSKHRPGLNSQSLTLALSHILGKKNVILIKPSCLATVNSTPPVCAVFYWLPGEKQTPSVLLVQSSQTILKSPWSSHCNTHCRAISCVQAVVWQIWMLHRGGKNQGLR